MHNMVDSEADVCWICLDEADEKRPVFSPCKCPRKVHAQCLARWQLQQAGRHEEKQCRFCNSKLIDWKSSLTPEELKPEVTKVQPIMVVYFEGEIHRIPVKQGPDGLQEFQNKIRALFKLPEDVDISLTFGCKEPMSGTHLKLEGTGAFDAAVHCASVAAAERQQRLKKSFSTSNLAARPGQGALLDPQPASGGTSLSGAVEPAAGGRHAEGAAAAAAQQQQPARRRLADMPESRARSRTFHVPSTRSPSAAEGRGGASGSGLMSFISALRPQRDTASNHPAAAAAEAEGRASSDTVTAGTPAADQSRHRQQQQQQQQPPSSSSPRQSQQPAAYDTVSRSAHARSDGLSRSQLDHVPGGEQAEQAHSRRALPELHQAAMRLSGPQAGSRSNSTSPRDSVSSLAEQYNAMPVYGDTVAVGSFSGKLRFHLRAFSRRVARSLSFTSKGQQQGQGEGGSAGPSSPRAARTDSAASLPRP